MIQTGIAWKNGIEFIIAIFFLKLLHAALSRWKDGEMQKKVHRAWKIAATSTDMKPKCTFRNAYTQILSMHLLYP